MYPISAQNIYTYKFHYIEDHPRLMAKLSTDRNQGRYFRFLIDSGADYTLIPKSKAILLGISYKKLKNTESIVEASNHSYIKTKTTHLYITIEKITVKIPVLICDEEVECLLGRKGVFENFNITFQEKNQRVIFRKSN